MLDKLKAVKVTLEDPNGTEVAATQAIYCEDVKCDSTAEYLRRNGPGKYVGNSVPGVFGAETGIFSGKTPLIGTGSSGMGLGCLILLQAAWLKKTLESYQVTSDVANWKCASIDVYEDGWLKTLWGAMFNVNLTWEQGRPEGAMLEVEAQGLYKAIEDVAVPAYAPEERLPMHMTGFTMNEVAKKIQSLSLNLNNVISPRPDPNAASANSEIAHFMVTDNDPTLGINPEAELVATYAFDALRRARTEHPIVATFGDGTDTIMITMPKVQAKVLATGERDGQLTYDYEGQCNHSTGDDAVVIAVT